MRIIDFAWSTGNRPHDPETPEPTSLQVIRHGSFSFQIWTDYWLVESFSLLLSLQKITSRFHRASGLVCSSWWNLLYCIWDRYSIIRFIYERVICRREGCEPETSSSIDCNQCYARKIICIRSITDKMTLTYWHALTTLRVTAPSRLDFHNMGLFFLYSATIGMSFLEEWTPKYNGHNMVHVT